MKVRSSWIMVSVLALVAVGFAFGAVSIRTDGDVEAGGQLISNELSLPPLQVSSSAMVTGLSAEFLGDLDSTDFAGAVHFHDDQYFTETELTTSGGGGALHWDNLTNVPPRADGPCFDNLNRYVNCGNGTETDNVTGLIWLKDPNCLDLFDDGFGENKTDWATANNAAALLADRQCGLTDGSSPGDWRLPTTEEWGATISFASPQIVGGLSCPVPTLTNIAGTACFANDPAFSGVQSFYWSSMAFEPDPSRQLFVDLEVGFASVVVNQGGSVINFVWPVRGGQ